MFGHDLQEESKSSSIRQVTSHSGFNRKTVLIRFGEEKRSVMVGVIKAQLNRAISVARKIKRNSLFLIGVFLFLPIA